MATHVDWHGDEAIDHVRGRAVRWLTRAAITVMRRAKELLSVAGTAVHPGTTQALHAATKAKEAKAAHAAAHAAAVRENRAFAKRFNERFKLQIQMGDVKKLRVTKAGHLTDRAKAGSKKVYYKNVNGKMVRMGRKRKK